LPETLEVPRKTQCGDKKRENSILLHERFLKLGAPLTVVLMCFAHGVGIYIYIYIEREREREREKNSLPHVN
jgi:hypothetical protein